ncbi:MFS transporter [Polymorphospora rubra]|uniref:MFS transporter n=1 Tax=Polymorphospora rubra TaxID=338584 RepID=UPI0033CA960D
MNYARSSRVAEFNSLWTAYTVTFLGNTIAMGALPFLALKYVQASAAQVSIMAALAAIASAVIALPLAPYVERLPKRRVLIATECVQFAAMASVVVAFAFDGLTYTHLCLVATIESAGSIVYLSAAGAFIKQTVAPDRLVAANARMEATNWTAFSVGPSVGGFLISAFGAVATMVVDAVSFVLGILCLLRVRGHHEDRPEDGSREPMIRQVRAGISHILRHRGLRGLYANAMLFGGAVTMTVPLLAVFMLRDLQLSAWQYGLALGAPAAAGLLGAALSPRIVTVLGARRALLWSGAARGPWILLLLLATAGLPGLVTILVSQALLLFTAGVFNPVFATYRMRATPDQLMTRVGTAWSASSKLIQPLCIVVGGGVAALAGVRPALLLAGALCLGAGALLPWRHHDPADGPTGTDDDKSSATSSTTSGDNPEPQYSRT